MYVMQVSPPVYYCISILQLFRMSMELTGILPQEWMMKG